MQPSWRVLKLDKELLLFPVFSTIACLLVMASFAAPVVPARPPPTDWISPIGVPPPAFGRAEAIPVTPVPWDNAVSGFYYVDTSHPQSTDTSNPTGYPAKPRKTIPLSLVPGSVVELRGGPYTYTIGGAIKVSGAGTVDRPIFVYGGGATPVVWKRPVVVVGSYIIIDNIDLDGWSTSNDSGIAIDKTSHHVAIRNCEIHNGPLATTSAVSVCGTNILLFRNTIHDNGDWHATYDQDHHGIGVGSETSNVWVLENTMFHNSGDGIQINAGNYSVRNTLHHIYVGRNLAYENKQTGFWCKFAHDVIFSENKSMRHRPSDSSDGAGMGWQYGSERIWFICNDVSDCENGIVSASISGPGGDGTGRSSFIVGNMIHNIHRTTGRVGSAWQDGCGIRFTDESQDHYVLNNTIHDVDAGIMSPRGSGLIALTNNLFSDVDDFLNIEQQTVANKSKVENCVVSGAGAGKIIWGESTYTTFEAFVAGQPTKVLNSRHTGPVFVAEAPPFALAPTSPCIDTGVSSMIYADFKARYGVDLNLDVQRHVRPVGAAYDIGAYERP